MPPRLLPLNIGAQFCVIVLFFIGYFHLFFATEIKIMICVFHRWIDGIGILFAFFSAGGRQFSSINDIANRH